MKLAFTKMHGAGNDFVVIDATREPVAFDTAALQRLADRHLGIGCDQILVVERPRLEGTDFHYRIFNADGGEVEQCGNGARCFVRFVQEKGLTDKREIRVGTMAGIISPRLEEDGRVTVDMGAPRLAPADIPFVAPSRADVYLLDLAGGAVEVSVVSMGNPHAVQVVADVDVAPVLAQGAQIESHPR
ncbi:MAG: diaminopimelate epimerase, partial [Proteobacteria bacterium]|nr:diaminopimelate epimerase [Pseudomonadota bacterium]